MRVEEVMEWDSVVEDCGSVAFPGFTGTRVLMMPMWLHDVAGSLPLGLRGWVTLVRKMVRAAPVRDGTGYLTIDEQVVPPGTHHRRPGLHVDGWSQGDDDGGWGGGGGGWARRGMMYAASHVGAVAYRQRFVGAPREHGDCEHLAAQCRPDVEVVLLPGRLYRLDPLTVHRTLPATERQARQFVRLSMPSEAGWHVSNTPNPLGIRPVGRLLPPRPVEFTEYRPT